MLNEFSISPKEKKILLSKFRNPECFLDPETGRDNETLRNDVLLLADSLKGLPHPLIKAKVFEYLCFNMRTGVHAADPFPAFGCWNRDRRPAAPLLRRWETEVNERLLPETSSRIAEFNRAGIYAVWKDFDHSVPDWDDILKLGFHGLLERAQKYREKRALENKNTPESEIYFESVGITYNAILKTLLRFACYAEKRAEQEQDLSSRGGGGKADGNKSSSRISRLATALRHLSCTAPGNLYEALLLIFLYFLFGEHVDHMQVRSLGNLDRILYPYYKRDLSSGTFTEEEIRRLLGCFMLQFASINNYWGHPFYLGGTEKDSSSGINELSFLILDVFDSLSITSPKIQLKYSARTPRDFLLKAFEMIRHGNSSLVFVSEDGIKRAMMSCGHTEEEARTCHVCGCYEFGAAGASNATAPCYLNLPKGIELLLNNGRDPMTRMDSGIRGDEIGNIGDFDSFYRNYLHFVNEMIEITVGQVNEFEKHLSAINPGAVLCAAIKHSLETARDAFSTGCLYNNTLMLYSGFASAVDSLSAIRKFVFREKVLSLSEMAETLRSNWEGREALRLRIRHDSAKYGNGDKESDFLAEMLANFLSSKINLRPNSRGGFWMASGHAARSFITLGEKTSATPDGRKKGEELSKNLSPVMGTDVNGSAALLRSVTEIDSSRFPGDFSLDVMMHPATVSGEDGLNVLFSLLEIYRKRNGIALHFNLFDQETLLDAQKHPEKYESLQVRVCGWNVRWNDLSRKEQDAYIERASRIRE